MTNRQLRRAKALAKFPISRDPPEGGTSYLHLSSGLLERFQFLGIPPKGELAMAIMITTRGRQYMFPISRDPPEGGTSI